MSCLVPTAGRTSAHCRSVLLRWLLLCLVIWLVVSSRGVWSFQLGFLSICADLKSELDLSFGLHTGHAQKESQRVPEHSWASTVDRVTWTLTCIKWCVSIDTITRYIAVTLYEYPYPYHPLVIRWKKEEWYMAWRSLTDVSILVNCRKIIYHSIEWAIRMKHWTVPVPCADKKHDKLLTYPTTYLGIMDQ